MSNLQYINEEVWWCADATTNVHYTYREQGPCLIRNDGRVYFSQIHLKTYNRRNGPARIYSDGTIIYNSCASCYKHRIDGPALRYANGDKEYWVNGREIPTDEFFLKYGRM